MWSLTCESKKINTWIITKQKQNHRYREQTSGYQWGEGREETHDKGRRVKRQGYSVRHREYSQYFNNNFKWSITCKSVKLLCCTPETNIITQLCGCVYVLGPVGLCDPMDCSPPGPSVPGISQARTLKCVAISSSRGSSRPRDWACIPCISYIGRWVLHHCATWEALNTNV